MKVFGLMIILSIGVFASTAQAESCRALLKNQQGYTLETFLAYGYNRSEACALAGQNCHRALRNGPYQGRYLRCEIQSHHNPAYVTRACQVSLEDNFGRRVRGFIGHSRGRTHSEAYQNACRTGLRQCHFFKNRYGYRYYNCRVRPY